MLQELSIQNFAIIPKLNLSFEPGMTVLTGETGAGKSIIIDAVGLLTGGRGSQDYIREGADKAVLQGLIDVDNPEQLTPVLEKFGIEMDDQQLLIHRELHRNGRNVIRINGTLLNATALKEVGNHLVDIHGQNEHQALMQVDQHLKLLDEYASNALAEPKAAYDKAYAEYRQLEKTLHERRENEQAWAQRMDMLTFQSEELKAADLQVGEEEKLEDEFQELSNYQDVLEALAKSHEVLDGEWEGNGIESISTALGALENIEEFGSRYKKLAESMREIFYSLQDVSSEIESVHDGLEFDAERLKYVDERLSLIRTLEQKYGATIADVLAHQDKVETQLAEMGGPQQSTAELEAQTQQAYDRALTLANQLHTIRQTAALELAQQIHEQLKDLYMEKAVFSVQLTQSEQLNTDGNDIAEFYIQTNPGESAKPLVKIASGGELSRMMLAMKMIFSREQGVTSIIFDEVDTGVSGRVAQAIAEKISDIGRHSQVLTITHLPQVAAVADHHDFIEKNIHDGRTETTVVKLSDEARVDEIARMLSGDELTEAARENARDLIAREQARRNQ
ncbi:DNA repair protein RecN [Weissella viridescens]|uniref:DNA repair protein RecN n=1 Tax=Weissella viridescens TaxID=1629 RepID=A0A0R2H7Y2_WEIVI|nr:DNA repair protein RecN [Weissella viridescens]KRN46709.1 dna repair and genetic recombination protein [Weissella viridescens]GEA94561.1 DNA repair protein RecN [Weissella viridescens]